MKQEWENLESLIKHKNDYMEILSSLNKPCSEEQIKLFEHQVKLKLPEDFKESLLVHNGLTGSKHDYFWLKDKETDWYLLNTTDMFHHWDENIYFRDEDYEPPFTLKDSGIRNVVWDKKWLPIAEDRNGTFCCIDMNPGPGGTTGQVFKLGDGDGDYHELLAKNFMEFFVNGYKEFLKLLK